MNATPSSQNTPTLGELLYADPSIARISEKDWVALVRAIGLGDEAALRVLYEKTYALVFTYLIRSTGDRELTDELIVDVYQDVWCEAPLFNGSDGPVLGWIMRQARAVALAVGNKSGSANSDGAGARRIPEDHRLSRALAILTIAEREAVEAAFLNGLSYSEMAAQWHEPPGTIKSRIRSGIAKLHRALEPGGDEA